MRTDAGPPGLLGPGVRTHWRVVLALTAGVGALLSVLLGSLDVRSYERTAGYLVASVPSSPADDRALVSSNVERAARDYATILQQDQWLMARLAAAVGREPDAVRDRLVAAYVPASSVIAIRYTGRSAEEVRAFFDVLDRTLDEIGVLTANFPPGTVRPLQQQGGLVTQVDPLRAHPAWGLVIGLALGVAVAVALERAHPRLGGKAHLQSLTDRAVLLVPMETEGTDSAVEALAVRLLAPVPTPRRVVVVFADDPGEAAATWLTGLLRPAAQRLAARGELSDDALAIAEDLVATAAEPLRHRAHSLGCVLVTRPGQSVRAVGSALDALADARPLVVALLEPPHTDATPVLADTGAAR